MPRKSLLRRLIRRIQILFFLTVGLTVSLAVGAFYYVQDGDFLRQRILAEAPRFFPTSKLEIAHARIRPILGECVLEHLKLWQNLSVAEAISPQKNPPADLMAATVQPQKKSPSLLPTLRLPFVRLLFDPWKMIQGDWQIQKVVVAQPALRLARDGSGKWNFDSLLANPWPMKTMGKVPTIQVVRGTLELVRNGPLNAGLGEQLHQPLPIVLRDVEMLIEPVDGSTRQLRFTGNAQGIWADRVQIDGIADLDKGTLEFSGSLNGLEPGPKMLEAVAPELITEWKKSGLSDLECNLILESATVQMINGAPRPSSYKVRADLLRGKLQRPDLPFPLNDLRATVVVKNDQIIIERAEAYHGKTVLRASGKSGFQNYRTDPLDITLYAINLQIDHRLQKVTPPQWQNFWVEYLPKGELNVAVHMIRDRPGGEIGFGVNTECRDVAICYEFFPYPIEHIWGQITWTGNTIRLGNPDKPPLEGGLRTILGNRPAAITGTIRNPGPKAEVDLVFEAENLSIDEPLLNALPPDTRRVVDAFQPTGEVKAKAMITRRPHTKPGDPSIGQLDVQTTIDLIDRCSIRWSGLPYPVHNMKGRLQLNTDHWTFENISGTNGTARIRGFGKVERIGPRRAPQAPFPRRRARPQLAGVAEPVLQPKVTGTPDKPGLVKTTSSPLKTHIELHADHLPFDEQLRTSLPDVWQTTWSTLNPIGSAKVDALIDIDPSKNLNLNQITIIPDAETRLNLVVQKRTPAGEPVRKPLELSLDQVQGQFVSTNGKVAMSDVEFQFRNSKVTIQNGEVVLQGNGQFDLWTKSLEARDLHLDAGLRQKMSPVMSQFARRLDDGRALTFRSDLRLGWSGKDSDPTWCRWENGLIILNGNSFDAGWQLKNLQGQVENVSGHFDGYDLSLDGLISLDSMSVKGIPLNQLSAPIHVEKGIVDLPSIQATVMGGQTYGNLKVQIEQEPQFDGGLKLVGLDLANYARTVPGRQEMRGRVSGQMNIHGRGSDTRNIQGQGSAEITQGDLGELPDFLQFIKTLNLSPASKTAFDSAQVGFIINNGKTTFQPIKFQGDAFSLDGNGSMSTRGELDVHLNVVYGRDRIHLPILSDAIKEATGQLFQVRVTGTPSFPEFRLDVLPSTFGALRTLTDETPLANPIGRSANSERRSVSGFLKGLIP
jgi:hypothetical protein